MKVTKICQYKASLVVIDVYSFFWGWMFKNGKILNNKEENKQKFKGNKKFKIWKMPSNYTTLNDLEWNLDHYIVVGHHRTIRNQDFCLKF